MMIKSPLLNELYKKLLNGDSNALSSFWGNIKKLGGTPLVEKDTSNENHALLTFLFQSSNDNVVLSFYSMSKKQMIRLPKTDVWYLTFTTPYNTRTIYCISPNDSLIFIHDNNFFNINLTEFCSDWQIDPLNSYIYKIPPYLTTNGKETLYSLVDLSDNKKNKDLLFSTPRKRVPAGKIEVQLFDSHLLKNRRKLQIYYPSGYKKFDEKSYQLLVVFDGDTYTDLIPTPTILNNLIDDRKIPPTIAIFISSPDPNIQNRSVELPCNISFAKCLVEEIMPWVYHKLNISRNPQKTILAGSSFGALAAAFVGLNYSETFGNILCQSGAFWWHPKNIRESNWLIRQYIKAKKLPLRFYLDCGTLENFQFTEQGDSPLSSVRCFRDVLITKNYKVHYAEFAGGHDYVCWKDTLGDGLMTLSSHN